MPGKALFDGSLQKLGECICHAYKSEILDSEGNLREGFCGQVGAQAVTIKKEIMKTMNGALPQLVVHAAKLLQDKRVSGEQICAAMLMHLKSEGTIQGKKESTHIRRILTDESAKIKRILLAGNTIIYGRSLSGTFVANGNHIDV